MKTFFWRESIMKASRLLSFAASAGMAASAAAQFEVVTSVPGNWVDISATGTPLILGDDQAVQIQNTVSNVFVPANAWVNSNGTIGLTSFTAWTNTVIPAAAFHGGRGLAPFWDDLNPALGGTIHWEQIGSTLILQFTNVPFFGAAGEPNTFQVQIFGTGTTYAQFLYQGPMTTARQRGNSATIGAQATASSGIMFSFNQEVLTPGMVITIREENPTAVGACCLPNGTCTSIIQSACTSQGGTWTSVGTTCTAANCPPAAACCFFDGTCAMLTSTACLAQAGSPQAAGTVCGTVTCPGIPLVVYSNCNLTTGTTTLNGLPAPSGSLWSEAAHAEGDPTTANDVAGFGGTGALRLADDFTVGAGGLNLAFVKIPSYLTGATGLTLTAATLRIWDGPPNDPTSQVVFGDTTTNRLAHAELSNIYRVWNTLTGQTCGGAPIPAGTTRRLQWGYIAVHQTLPEGTYWLDWNFTGTSFAPGATSANAIGRQCDPNNSNSLQFNGTWVSLIDNGYGCVAPAPLAQDMYFELLGTPGSTCYANCDGSTVAPVLNVDDFTCFINEYASAQGLPPAQQINHYANCDGSTVEPVLNVDDFTCFINAYAQGCP
jgi:hypothetical protein